MIKEKYEIGEVEQYELGDLTLNGELNPRSSMNEKNILELTKTEFLPPIKLGVLEDDLDTIYLIDGNHRVASRRALNEAREPDNQLKIDGVIKLYKTFNDMFVDATLYNLNHGVRLNKEDRIDAIANIIEALGDDFSASKLAEKLNAQPRELVKIKKWIAVRNIVGPEDLGHNISKADVFSRLLTKGEKTEEEFAIIFNNLKDLTFAQIQDAVKRIIDGEDLDSQDLAIEASLNDEKEIEGLISDNDFEINDDDDFDKLEDFEENDVINVKYIIEDLKSDVKIKIENLKVNKAASNVEIMSYEGATKDIEEVRELLNELEELI